MDKTKVLQNLLKGKATKKEIELLKQALVSGEISIGGDVQRSIVIMGDGNSISLTPEALDLLKPETKTEEQGEGDPPYMGLRYFDTQDADLFYGREALTRELLARVQKESFLAIVGASGSGKSSVARAGLIPAWTKENKRGAIHVITPTAHPLESLAASFTRESESVTATSRLMDDLKNDSRSLRLYVKKTFGETQSLLLVDQFEETFTLCKDADERKVFIENLLALADEDGAARVVITLRADFYHHCAEYEGLRNVLKTHQEYIGAMTADELRQAIIAPAETHSWDFQPGLVDLILQDIGAEPGALPLLSHALLETWKRRLGRTLTLKGYADAGGVKKAIAQTAESVYDQFTPAEQNIARGIFLKLTELGEGVQDTRRRVKLDELSQRTGTQDSVAKVLKILTDARLVTTEHESAEVAHEALIREWGTLRKWLDEDRESLRLHRHLTKSAQEWERSGRDDLFLIHRGSRLEDVTVLAKDSQFVLSVTEQDYLNACLLLRDREKQEHERRVNEQRQFRMLQVTLDIIETMGSVLDLEKIIDKILEKLYLQFENTNVLLLLYNKNTNNLEFAPGTFKYYQVVNRAHTNDLTIKLDNNSIPAKVAKKSFETKKQEYILVSNIENSTDYLMLNSKVRSELCVSLLNSEGDLLGIIVLERDSFNGFDKNDVALVEIVSRQLSLAFERSILVENLSFKSTIAAQTSWSTFFAYELNNEVGKIVNWAYLIQMIMEEKGEIFEYAKNIEESGYRITSMNPWTARPRKPVELDSTLINITQARKYGIQLEFQFGAPNIKVKLNISQIQFMFKELIINAARAMLGMETKKILIATKLRNNSTVEIHFQDFGPGFDDNQRALVFRKSFTTKSYGGGYGLLFIRQIIEDIQGKIELLPNQPDRGAAFLITVPVDRSE